MYQNQLVSSDEAVLKIAPGKRIYIGSNAGVPQELVAALDRQKDHFLDNEVVHLLILGKADYVLEGKEKHFRHNAFFIGANVRESISQGRADYSPIFLSEIPDLFLSKQMPLEAALVSVSPPDKNGYCSLGISVDVGRAALEMARIKIGQINSAMPRTHGESFIHVDQFDYLVEKDEDLPTLETREASDVDQKIAYHIAQLIPDGATLQMGIGAVPNAVLPYLKDRNDLGVHTEMFSDGLLELVDMGVVTNKNKTIHTGKIVAGFCMGSKQLYERLDDNPLFAFYPSDFVNSPFIIGQNPEVIAINSAIQVDLTGQVCADSIGNRFFSGIGGQVDFMRGAAYSKGGKPIIAMPSTAKGGHVSRIVAELSEGAGVVTSRGDVHYIVTEYGVAYLHGKSMKERALALIEIAHPDFREELISYTKETRHIMIDLKKRQSIYPDYYEDKIQTEEGDLWVRPLKMSDERSLQDFFYSHKRETIYQRYLKDEESMSSDKAQKLVCLDYHKTMALSIWKENQELREIVAVGRYVLNESTGIADVFCVVSETMRDQGLGTYLLQKMIVIAKEKDFKGVAATYFRNNTHFSVVFKKVASAEGEVFITPIESSQLEYIKVLFH